MKTLKRFDNRNGQRNFQKYFIGIILIETKTSTEYQVEWSFCIQYKKQIDSTNSKEKSIFLASIFM